jgi:hypothetical protein
MLKHFKDDEDFDGIRGLDSFKALMRELEGR